MEVRRGFNIGKYFISVIADMVFLYGFIILLSIVSAAILGLIFTDPSSDSELLVLIVLCTATVWCIYFFVLLKRSGQTISMKLFHFKIEPVYLNKLSFLDAFWWGFFMSIPVTALGSVLVAALPPCYTFLKRITNTKIIEVLSRDNP